MIGVDLIYIPEFKNQMELGGQVFLDKAFNKGELGDKSPEHLAGIWAAKEAVFKAAQNQPANLKQIKISYKNNKPSAELDGVKYQISIAHHHEYAVGVAVRNLNDKI